MTETRGDLEQQAYAKVSRRLLPFLFLCYICAYLDRVNLGFAKLQMVADLKLDDAVFATGAGVFFIGYFLFEVPSNIILRRVGARIWIARIMITWGLLSAAMMFVRTERAFYVLRFLLGFAEAGFFPGIVYYLTNWYPAKMRARRTAFFMAAIAFSGIVGNPISGLIMDSFSGALHLAGWQWLFLLEGIPSVLIGVWVLFYLDSSIGEAKWLADEEKALLLANLQQESRGKAHASLGDAFRSARVWVLCAVYFCMMVGLYGIAFWLPTIVKALGLSSKSYVQVGLLSAIPYGVSIVAMFAIGRHSDRTGERGRHTMLSIFAGGLGLLLCGLCGHQPALSIAALSLATLGVLSAMPLFWTIPAGFLTDTAAAAGIGIINSLGNLGGYVGPNIPIWVKPYLPGDAAPLYAIAGILFAGSLLAALFVERKA